MTDESSSVFAPKPDAVEAFAYSFYRTWPEWFVPLSKCRPSPDGTEMRVETVDGHIQLCTDDIVVRFADDTLAVVKPMAFERLFASKSSAGAGEKKP